MIVVDKEGDDAYVVMDLDQYEAILVQKQEEKPSEQLSQQDVWDLMQQAGDQGQTWDTNSLTEEELANLEQQYREFAARHVQEAIEETVQQQETVAVAEEVSEQETEETEKNGPETTQVPVQQEVEEIPVIIAEPEVEQKSVQNSEKTEVFSEDEQEDEFGEEQFYLEPIE